MFKASDIEQSHYPVHKSSKQKQLVFPQFVVEPADRIEKEIKAIRTPLEKNGMDFGFVTSYNAALWMVVDHDHKIRFRMKACKKFKGSRAMYTKKVKRFKKIVCSDACPNTIDELQDLTFTVDKDGEIIEDEFNIDPHTLSAIWYALDDYEVSNLKGGGLQSKW